MFSEPTVWQHIYWDRWILMDFPSKTGVALLELYLLCWTLLLTSRNTSHKHYTVHEASPAISTSRIDAIIVKANLVNRLVCCTQCNHSVGRKFGEDNGHLPALPVIWMHCLAPHQSVCPLVLLLFMTWNFFCELRQHSGTGQLHADKYPALEWLRHYLTPYFVPGTLKMSSCCSCCTAGFFLDFPVIDSIADVPVLTTFPIIFLHGHQSALFLLLSLHPNAPKSKWPNSSIDSTNEVLFHNFG